MRLTSQQGGTLETLPGDGFVCCDGLGGVWFNGKRHDARAVAVRTESVRGVHRDWSRVGLDPLLYSVVTHL